MVSTAQCRAQQNCMLQFGQHFKLQQTRTILNRNTCFMHGCGVVCTQLVAAKRQAIHAACGSLSEVKPVRSATGLAVQKSRAAHIVPRAAATGAAGLLDLNVVSAAGQASFKLLFLCAVVAMLSERGMIPANASQVMSKVAFNLTIPAMLLASTTKTLANCQATNLIGIPAIAVAQIAFGALFGRWAAAAVEGKLPFTRWLLKWGDLNPTPSATAIAASTAAALRAPAAAPALLPKSPGYPEGLPQLTQLACAFGNTVTLPLMYLMTMLPAADASRATGFMSLFHAAWSPCLWVFGYRSIQGAGKLRTRRRRGFRSQMQYLWRTLTSRTTTTPSSSSSSSSSSGFSPPSSQPAVLVTKQLPTTASSGPGQSGRAVYAVPSEPEQPDETPAEMLVKRVWGFVMGLMQLGLVQQVAKVINPPVAAVMAGVALGMSPAGSLLCDSTAAASFVSTHTHSAFTAWELTVLLGLLRCCWETVEMLASGTLALQAIVLAASLFGPKDSSQNRSTSSSSSGLADTGEDDGQDDDLGASGVDFSDAQKGTVEVESPGGITMAFEGLASSADYGPAALSSEKSSGFGIGSSGSGLTSQPASDGFEMASSSSNAAGSSGRPVLSGLRVTHQSASTADDASSSVLSQLKPQAAWEWRAMLAVAAVRFVLLPCATTVLVLTAARFGFLPADPVCAFMLMLQSAMPPAQNLVLMMQLQQSTAELAPATARLLLQLYTLAVLPVTLWVSVFAKLVL